MSRPMQRRDDSTSSKSTTLLQWGKKPQVLAAFPIGWRTLEEWSNLGIVRNVKLDPSKQGRRLYCLADLADAVNRISQGLQPKIQTGRRVN